MFDVGDKVKVYLTCTGNWVRKDLEKIGFFCLQTKVVIVETDLMGVVMPLNWPAYDRNGELGADVSPEFNFDRQRYRLSRIAFCFLFNSKHIEKYDK